MEICMREEQKFAAALEELTALAKERTGFWGRAACPCI